MSELNYLRPLWVGKGTDKFKVVFSIAPTNLLRNKFSFKVNYNGTAYETERFMERRGVMTAYSTNITTESFDLNWNKTDVEIKAVRYDWNVTGGEVLEEVEDSGSLSSGDKLEDNLWKQIQDSSNDGSGLASNEYQIWLMGDKAAKHVSTLAKDVVNESNEVYKQYRKQYFSDTDVKTKDAVEIGIISAEGRITFPSVEGKVTLELKRYGSPGTLKFSILKDNNLLSLNFGDVVRLRADDRNVFWGYIFAEERDEGDLTSITAYDQLRYLSNSDTYVYPITEEIEKGVEGWSASTLVRAIAADYGLELGEIDDTEVLLNAIEDNQTLFDII